MAKVSGGTLSSVYLLNAANQQITELNGSGLWMHSNVYTPGGRLLATYEGPGESSAGYRYNLTDWLGTKRLQTNSNGNQEEACTSLPFGDSLTCTGVSDATEQHFTGKDRDSETGLDYFGARYLSSNFARFMTPDWADKPASVPYAQFGDPQSLNLYAYVSNNPNTGIDVDGHLDGNISPENGVEVDEMNEEEEALQSAAQGMEETDGLGSGYAAGQDATQAGQQNSCPVVPSITVSLTPTLDQMFAMAWSAAASTSSSSTAASTTSTTSTDSSASGNTGATGASGATKSSSSEGPKYLGDNPKQGSGRVNTDKPGGQKEAGQAYGEATKGQTTQVDPKSGHTVAADGTRLRNLPDGTARIDRPASVTGGQHETIHFNQPN